MIKQQILYLYESHIDGSFYITEYEAPELECNICNDSDTLVCLGTKESIIQFFENEIEYVKKMIAGEIPQDEDYYDLEEELITAYHDMYLILRTISIYNTKKEQDKKER